MSSSRALAHDADHDPREDRDGQAEVDEACASARRVLGRGSAGGSQPGRARATSRRATAGWRRRGRWGACRARIRRGAVRRHRHELVVARGRARRAEDRHHARVVAVRVVVGGHLAELRDPAGEVRRVAARVLDHRVGAVERPDRAREDGAVSSASRGCLAVSSIRSLFGPGAPDQRRAGRRSSGRASCDERAQRAEERRELLRVRLRHLDELVEVVERACAGSRRSCSPSAACPAAARARAEATCSRRRSRASPCSCCPPGREVVAALGDRGRPCRRRPSGSASSTCLVERELLRQPRRLPRNGAKYLDALAGLGAARVVLVAGAADEVAEAPARLRVERVEQHVEVDRRGGLVRADAAAVVDLRVRCSARASARRSGSRCRTARWPGWWPSCPRAAVRPRRPPPSSRPRSPGRRARCRRSSRPAGRPPGPRCPCTSWPALSKTALTWYGRRRRTSRARRATTAAISAAVARIRPRLEPRSLRSGSRVLPSLVFESKRGQPTDASRSARLRANAPCRTTPCRVGPAPPRTRTVSRTGCRS